MDARGLPVALLVVDVESEAAMAMDDGWPGVSVSSCSQKLCKHFVSVRCRCSQNAHKVLTKQKIV